MISLRRAHLHTWREGVLSWSSNTPFNDSAQYATIMRPLSLLDAQGDHVRHKSKFFE